MSRMQVVQQKQPVSSWERAKAPLKITAVVLVQTAAIIASLILSTGIFAIGAALTLSMAMAISLRERGVILAVATAFTALIAAVSLAALFPFSIPFMISLVSMTATFSFGWGLRQQIKQMTPSSNQ